MLDCGSITKDGRVVCISHACQAVNAHEHAFSVALVVLDGHRICEEVIAVSYGSAELCICTPATACYT